MSSFPRKQDIAIAGGVAAGLAAGAVGLKAYYDRRLLRSTVDQVYDYIVVGGGTAGCVLASRLSEDAGVRVLLLEAGPPDTSNAKVGVPAAASELQRSEVDWAFQTEPCAQLRDRVSRWPRGKVLGGSSCLNWMLWVRGHPDDYDAMERDLGATGWGYASLLPYFVKAESMVGDVPDESLRGRSGPIHVERLASPNAYTDVWLQAAQQSGLPLNDDYNSGRDMLGCARAQLTIRAGKRVSAAVAYLHDTGALQRPNLTVRCGVHVTRVVLEGAPTPRAVAVEYQTAGEPDSVKKYVLAQREIVLCAGAVQSPQLLMLSGVGDPRHLTEVDVECRVPRPGVGQNLQDHLMVPVGVTATKPLTMDLHGLDKLGALLRYVLTSGGPVASQGLEAMAFVDAAGLDQLLQPSGEQRPVAVRGPAPELQVHFVCAGGRNDVVTENLNYPAGYNDGVERGFCSLPSLLHPKSVGSVRLASAQPFDAPCVKPNYLEHPDDMQLLVRGVRLARKIHNALAFDGYRGLEIIDEDIARLHHPDSDDYIRELIRRRVITIYHPVGTCKIGSPSDPLAVVDPELRVYGVLGLRVADCSVYPKLVGANTYACAVVAGEKCADLIKKSPPLPPAHPSLLAKQQPAAKL